MMTGNSGHGVAESILRPAPQRFNRVIEPIDAEVIEFADKIREIPDASAAPGRLRPLRKRQ